MNISEKIKTINNKTKQSKAQCDLDRQTPKISDLSPVNVSKYEVLTVKDVFPENNFQEKPPAKMKRI